MTGNPPKGFGTSPNVKFIRGVAQGGPPQSTPQPPPQSSPQLKAQRQSGVKTPSPGPASVARVGVLQGMGPPLATQVSLSVQ